MPPCAIGASSRSGIASTNSRAWAISSAAHISSSVASGLPIRRLLATVPENRYGFCGTSPIRAHSSSGSRPAYVDPVDAHLAAGDVEQPRHQVHQRRLAGAGGADDRGRLAGPGGEGQVPQHRLLGTGIGELHAAELQLAAPRSTVTGSAGGTTEVSVSSTSAIRSAHTDARGIMISMNVAIITDIRICIR